MQEIYNKNVEIEGAFEVVVTNVRKINMVQSDEQEMFYHIFTVKNLSNKDWPTLFTIKGNMLYEKFVKDEVIQFAPTKTYKMVTYNGRKNPEYTICENDVLIKILPADKISLIKFMQSTVKGIGPKTIEKIIDVKGEDTISFLANSSIDDINDAYPFLKVDKQIALHENITEYVGYYNIVMFLIYNGCDTHHARTLWKKHRFSTNNIMQDNALYLGHILDLEETMAIFHNQNKSLIKITPENYKRLLSKTSVEKANLQMFEENYAYFQKLFAGLTHYGLEKCEKESQYTAVPLEVLFSGVKRLALTYSFVYDLVENITLDEYKTLVTNFELFDVSNGAISLKKTSTTERNIVEMLNHMNRHGKYVDNYSIKDFFNDGQRKAIDMCLSNQVSILTGGAGVGKTTTLGEILRIINDNPHLKPRLYAPTGKAASRMSEATGEVAKTLQSLTHAINSGLKPSHRPTQKQIEKDIDWINVYIIDEFSMVDIYTLNTFLKFINKSSDILIIVGDDNQLPSIGPGSLLRDLIAYTNIPKIKLNVTVRQDKNSLDLAEFIDNIQYHKPIDMTPRLTNSLDIYDLNKHNVSDIIDLFVSLAKKGELDETILLTPMNKYETGTIYLNEQIRSIINPDNIGLEEIEYKFKTYREKDRVMQTVNRDELTNGMVGYIYSAYTEEDLKDAHIIHHIVEVDYNGMIIKYTGEEITELNLAYAITVHKSQGSEYKNIIMLIDKGHSTMLNHGLLYTGITRAKGKLFLFADKQSFLKGCGEKKNMKRFTWIQENLKSGNYKYGENQDNFRI